MTYFISIPENNHDFTFYLFPEGEGEVIFAKIYWCFSKFKKIIHISRKFSIFSQPQVLPCSHFVPRYISAKKNIVRAFCGDF